jgi:acyl-CoA synthetase (AMP-forming)/AMP-acid ligase II
MTALAFDPWHAPTLVDLLQQRAEERGDRRLYTFLLDGEGDEAVVTYRDLDRKARSIAARLQEVSQVGDRALLIFQPGLDFIAAFFGCLYAGVAAVPVYPPHPARLQLDLPRLVGITRNAAPRLVLTTGWIAGMAEDLGAEAPALREPTWIATDELTDDSAGNWRDPGVRSDTLAFLQYTSGSTSAPRGVMLHHSHLLYNERMIQTGYQHDESAVVVSWVPLYHDMGLIGKMLQPLFVGSQSTFMSPMDFLQKPVRWLQAISKYRATTSGGPNFAYDLCIRKTKPEQKAALDLSSWVLACNAAEPVRPATMRQFAEAFAECGFKIGSFYPCYGLAEATLIVTGAEKFAPLPSLWVKASTLEAHRVEFTTADDPDGRELAGCGHAILEQEVRIVDPFTCKPCAADAVGEIWVKGPNVAAGYWDNPDATDRTFNGRVAGTNEGPYLRTGDLGFLHGDELYVTGRIKDLVILAGRNIYPQDIERTVEEQVSGIRPGCSAAFSVDVDSQERLVVVAEIEPSQLPDGATVDSITSAIRQVVANRHEAMVYRVHLLPARMIPKTSSGKIQRHACREGFLKGDLPAWEP